MPVNVALGHVSNAFLIAALVIYSLSVVAFAGDFAFGRPRRAAAAARGQQAQDRASALASVGAVGGAAPAGPEVPATLLAPGETTPPSPPVPLEAAAGGGPADGEGSMPELEVPALQSYGLDIHVTAMTLATGIFFVPAVLGFVYLWVDRYTRRVAAGQAAPGNGIVRRLPGIEQLDRLTYRTIVFGFPVWTFGVIAGAIWADQAWGRYWGWDPVETWAFITWVLYAAFLHARATAGWRGRRAHYVQLLGFASLIFNILVVQVFIAGLHSYSGVG